MRKKKGDFDPYERIEKQFKLALRILTIFVLGIVGLMVIGLIVAFTIS